MNPEKLKSLQDQVRIGGKGTARRKKKVVHKTSSSDDKKLQNHLKKMGMNSIPGIEEVNMFQDDGNVLHFNNPKVSALIPANTFSISGPSETKSLAELLPNVLSQLDPQSLSGLKKLFSSPAAKNGSIPEAANEQEDVPELTGDFETVAESS
ncbi:transcription factor BTF3 homolog isoform X1 [Sycon ciliatum]|uniref:transcription factor BTF3 homolog isoform X1 n=1 Tax=Sycon ciliatum TaxID=27933 RepID=UPI0020AE459D|eukprot:scpid100730/ scgid30120/ Transcription factor BTF3 homolog; Inhibitor of cell death 1